MDDRTTFPPPVLPSSSKRGKPKTKRKPAVRTDATAAVRKQRQRDRAKQAAIESVTPQMSRVTPLAPAVTPIAASVTRAACSAGTVIFCAAPAAALNIWPRLHDMIAGQVDPKAVGLVAAQSVFVAIMAATPFALQRPEADRRHVRVIGAMCLAMNFYLAQDSISSIFDAQSDPKQAAIDHKVALETDLAEARANVIKLGVVNFTTQDQADEAKKIADTQCLKPGPKCEAANKVLKDRGQTVEADRLNKQIDNLSDQLRSLPPVPSDAHKVQWWWPPALALAAELAAMYGGYVLTLALCL
jgi:hypothetical protein